MLLATSATIEGIGKMIAEFYGGERKELRPVVGQGPTVEWTVHRASVAQIESVHVVLRKGCYRFQRKA